MPTILENGVRTRSDTAPLLRISGIATFAMVAAERPADADLIVATSTVGITQIGINQVMGA